MGLNEILKPGQWLSESRWMSASSDDGNLIKERKDGLYYGVEATREYQNVFVDAVTGVDSPERGAFDKPFKTLKYACEIETGTNRVIYLKEAQLHVVDSIITFKGGTVSIYPYGDRTASIPDSPGDVKYVLKEVWDIGTRIVFIPNYTDKYYYANNLLTGLRDIVTTIRIMGFHLDLYPHPKYGNNEGLRLSSYVALDNYDASFQFELRGCSFHYKNGAHEKGTWFFDGGRQYRATILYNLNGCHDVTGGKLIYKLNERDVKIVLGDANFWGNPENRRKAIGDVAVTKPPTHAIFV